MRLTRGAALASIAIVGLLGWVLGTVATKVPSIDLGPGWTDSVWVWVDDPSTAIEVEWKMDVAGDVELWVRSLEERKTSDPLIVAIILECEARFRLPLEESQYLGGLQVAEVGTEAGCEYLAEGEPGTQVFKMVLTDGSELIHGWPVGDWTTRSLSQRTARTPVILMGNDEKSQEIDGKTFFQPIAGSKVKASLVSTDAEVLDTYYPTEVPNGKIELTTNLTGGDSDLKGFGPTVRWEAIRAQDTRSLRGGVARWLNPAGTAASQRFLLLSGLMLGVAASLLVELFVRWVPNEMAGQSGITSSAAPRSHRGH